MDSIKRMAFLSNFFNLGGVQQLAYAVCRVAKKSGYDLDVYTGYKSTFLPDNTDRVIKLGYPHFSDPNRMMILVNEILLRRELSSLNLESYSLTFNNQPNTFLFNASMNYLHGPSFFESFMNLDGKVDNPLLYRIIRTLGIYKIYGNGLFLTHGNYSKEYAMKGFKLLNIMPRKIVAINTPVQYSFLDRIPEKELNTVLTFGRISPDKNLEIISHIARHVSVHFIIAGYISKDHVEYAKKLKSLMPDNVTLIENPSEDDKIKLYRKANIYLHTKPREHFGVTVAEALWFGCIPIVPKSGGAWEDIVSEGKFGYGYDNESDLINIIKDLKLAQIDDVVFESRFRFSMETFEDKLNKILLSITD